MGPIGAAGPPGSSSSMAPAGPSGAAASSNIGPAAGPPGAAQPKPKKRKRHREADFGLVGISRAKSMVDTSAGRGVGSRTNFINNNPRAYGVTKPDAKADPAAAEAEKVRKAALREQARQSREMTVDPAMMAMGRSVESMGATAVTSKRENWDDFKKEHLDSLGSGEQRKMKEYRLELDKSREAMLAKKSLGAKAAKASMTNDSSGSDSDSDSSRGKKRKHKHKSKHKKHKHKSKHKKHHKSSKSKKSSKSSKKDKEERSPSPVRLSSFLNGGAGDSSDSD